MASHENRSLFQELRNELLKQFEPMALLELMLAERLTVLFWRERRLAAAEEEQLEIHFREPQSPLAGQRTTNMPVAEQYLVDRNQGMLGRQTNETLR